MTINTRPEGVRAHRANEFPAFGIGANQKVSFTDSSASFTATSSTLVRFLSLSVACHINIDSTATTSHMPLAPGGPEYFRLEPGDVIHVVSAGSDGVLHITEMV